MTRIQPFDLTYSPLPHPSCVLTVPGRLGGGPPALTVLASLTPLYIHQSTPPLPVLSTSSGFVNADSVEIETIVEVDGQTESGPEPCDGMTLSIAELKDMLMQHLSYVILPLKYPTKCTLKVKVTTAAGCSPHTVPFHVLNCVSGVMVDAGDTVMQRAFLTCCCVGVHKSGEVKLEPGLGKEEGDQDLKGVVYVITENGGKGKNYRYIPVGGCASMGELKKSLEVAEVVGRKLEGSFQKSLVSLVSS